MNKRSRIGAVIAMLSLAVACVPGENTSESEQAVAATKAPPPPDATELPPASVLIAHRVSDYNAWKRRFDDHMQARKAASCLGHYLKQGLDAPDMAYVYCLARDADKLRAFLDSAELAEAMEDAGVEGAPEIMLMQPMTRDLIPEQRLPGIIVMHAVEDYDAWRVAYDELDDFRRKSGIVGHAVSRGLDNPNHVVAYHQADNEADLRAFVESVELAEAMQRAGVVSDPDVRFIQVVDFAQY